MMKLPAFLSSYINSVVAAAVVIAIIGGLRITNSAVTIATPGKWVTVYLHEFN
jgi:hypothetical protein